MDIAGCLDDGRLAGLLPRTLEARGRLLRLVERHAGKPIDQVTEADLRDWWASLADLAPASRKVYLSHVRAYYRAARIPDLSTSIRSPKVPPYQPQPLSHADRDRLLANVGGEDGLWIALMLTSGLRCSEVAALTEDDVVRHGGSTYLRIVGKGLRRRTVPAHPIVVARLVGYTWPARPYWPSEVSARVGRAMRAAGVDSTAHKLRHTAATDYLAVSGSIADTSRFLGHQSLNTTMGYAASVTGVHDAVVARMLD